MIDNLTIEDVNRITKKYRANVRGARRLEREIIDDLKPMFGDKLYTTILINCYGDDLYEHRDGYATIFVLWMDKHDRLKGWSLIIKTFALHNRIVMAAITSLVATCLNRYTRKPPVQIYGLIDQNEWTEEVWWAAKGLYDSEPRRRKELNKMVALYGIGPIPEYVKV